MVTKQPNQQFVIKTRKQATLVIEDLSFFHSNERLIWQNIDLTIFPGERVGLIGPNGAGKTTLFLTVCGILPPTSGKIMVLDKPVQVGGFRPEIGLVFQNPDDQLFCTTVRDDVAFGPENMGFSPQEIDARVQQALGIAGVEHLVDRVPSQLSGGEKCMVAIATILAMQPQLILYDEPSANLDLRARRRLIEFLQKSPETFIICSHDLELILEVCASYLLLDEGKIIADGKPQEVMADHNLMESHSLERPHSLSHRHH